MLANLWILVVRDAAQRPPPPLLATIGEETYLPAFSDVARARRFAAAVGATDVEPRLVTAALSTDLEARLRRERVRAVMIDYDRDRSSCRTMRTLGDGSARAA
jgi:hypothetical protein